MCSHPRYVVREVFYTVEEVMFLRRVTGWSDTLGARTRDDGICSDGKVKKENKQVAFTETWLVLHSNAILLSCVMCAHL